MKCSGVVKDRRKCVCLKLVCCKGSANIFMPVSSFENRGDHIASRYSLLRLVSWKERRQDRKSESPNKIYLVLSFESVSFVSELRITEAAGSIDN